LTTILGFLAVFLSGAGALTYEIIWQRQMFLIFGASAPATTAILTAIFIGIAFGSWFAVPFLKRTQRPLLLFIAAETAIAIWGMLVPFALSVASRAYVQMAHSVDEGSAVLSFARFALAVLPLLPATLCMGATIPVMVQAIGAFRKTSVAWIYGVNILGAVTGSLATGMLWIRLLGQSETRWIAVGCNVAAVVVLWLLNRQSVSQDESQQELQTEVVGPVVSPRLMGSMYFAAGFVALGLEVIWLRFLGIINTNSTVTFSLTLAVYLLGTGLGSLFVFPLMRKYLSGLSVFVAANAGIALFSLLTFATVYAAPAINHEHIVLPSRQGVLELSDIYTTEAQIIFRLMFLPTIFMGLVYPAVCDCMGGSAAQRRDWIAFSYFLGTLGSVVGILTVSLFIIPLLGLHGTFSALVIVSAVLSGMAAWFYKQKLAKQSALLMSVGLIGWSLLITFDARPVLRDTIARRDGEQWMEYTVENQGQPTTELVRFKAGSSATVIVKKELRKDEFLVYVDDQLVASTNTGAKVDALMLAHLPLLLHAEPENELTVGFGSGGTSHAITTHQIDSFCVEIEPEVPRSASLLRNQNFDILDNPRFQLILNDARDHLQITERLYDVIATDVTNLQYKQNTSLYTVEYFQLMHDRLQEDGIACAWIPMAAITSDELRILMKSFQEVFPHATLWYMNHTHTNFGILIGTPEALQIDYTRLQEGFATESIAESMRQIGLVEPLQLVHCLHLDEEGYRQFCGDVELHTDNDPVLEFSSPLSFYQYYETFHENLFRTMQLRPTDFQRYVINGPAADDPQWVTHRLASAACCDVILAMYEFIVLRDRNERGLATNVLKRAIQAAEQGMSAWPEDRSREKFYSAFFEDAGRWVGSQQP
jgi:spermidine synthase